jgi:hypothetical protein
MISKCMALAALAAGAAWGQLTVNCPALPQLVGTAVNATCVASGGVSPYSFSVSAGALPPGLTMDTGGDISGTLVDPAGPYSFTVTATDSTLPNPLTGSQAFSGTTVDALTVSCTLASGPVEAGVLYANSCTAAGGTPPYAWTITGSSVPPGLSITPTGNPGTIGYTPASADASYQYRVVVTDSSSPALTNHQTFNGAIAPAVTISTTSPLPGGAVGSAYSQQLAATGGVTPYAWSATGLTGTGLSLNPTSGQLSGTPVAAGTVSFSATVTDSVGGTTGAVPFTIGVLGITTTSPLTAATVGSAYSQQFAATGGTGPYSWSATGLPVWLAMSSAGLLTSTPGPVPVSAVDSTFTVKVTDSSSNSTSGSFTLPVTLAITTTNLPAAVIGMSYGSQTLTAAGGTGGYTWVVTTGSLPAGLSLSTGGVISGTPQPAAESSSFTVKVTDSSSATASAQLTIAVTPVITTTSPLPTATIGAPYTTQTFTAEGGASGYTWAVTTGSPPAGLSLSTAGVLSGTPTSNAQNATFTVTVTDKDSVSASASFTLPVNLAITSSSPLGPGAIHVGYSQALAGAGGLPPYSWSVVSGSLPNGLTLNANGTITGTPSIANSFTFTVQLSDNAAPPQTPVQKQFVITISAGLTITTTSLPNATVGVLYSQTLGVVGGSAPYTWSITAGALPAQLSLNPNTGAITGIPSAAGASTFTATVTDSAGTAVSQQLTLTVVTPPVITTKSLPNGSAGVSYSQTLGASGGTPPYQWAIVSGSLPGGLSLSSSGTISGIPGGPGTANFTAQLTDATGVTASQSLTLTIGASLTISTTSPLATGEIGVAYSQTLAATGGTSPYTWSVGGGALPGGLTLASNGSLTGTPNAAGTFGFTAQVTDSNHATASAALSVTIDGALSISTPASLAGGSVNAAYSQTLAASGGASPYTWTLASGALPPGLSLSAAGKIAGVPTAPGTFAFTVDVTDALGAKASRQFTIAIVNGLTVASPVTLPGATVGVGYSDTLLAAGGTGPYTWAITAGLPPGGLSLRTNGNLTGTPTIAGTFTFTVQVTDSKGHQASAQLSITVTAVLSIVTSTLPGGTTGAAYSQQLAASGGTPPYSWSIVSGALPGGLSLSSSGSISGTISAAGSFLFTVQVTDSASATATRQFSISAVVGLSITTAAALPNAFLNSAYSETLTASGGSSYTWALTGGALPSGLTLSSAGAITGTPTAAGASNFTATVTDSASATASQAFTLVVEGTLAIATTSLPGGTVGASYTQALTATGGKPPYTFAKTAGSLPPGISLSGAALSGTFTIPGTFNLTVQVTDSANATASQAFSIVVTGLAVTTQSLPGAAVGAPYSATLQAAGTPSYTWSVTRGALPGGLSLDTSSGTISGTPTAAGNFSFTVEVTDSTKATASAAFTVAVLPEVTATYSGLTATATSAEQISGSLALGAAYPQAITGQITLAFAADSSLSAPSGDPSIQFSTGGDTASFTIPANSTTPVPFSLQTGTVAGTITLTVSWQAGGVTLAVPAGLTQSIQIDPSAPVISAVTATASSSSLTVTITGYSNTRELTEAMVQFAPATGQTLQTTSLTVPLTSAAASWFGGSASDQYGSQFTLTLPFTVSNGDASAIGSVSVQLVNTKGTSSSASATP